MHSQPLATGSGAGGLWAAAGLVVEPKARRWQPVVAPDGQLVTLSVGTRPPKGWEETKWKKPYDKLREPLDARCWKMPVVSGGSSSRGPHYILYIYVILYISIYYKL